MEKYSRRWAETIISVLCVQQQQWWWYHNCVVREKICPMSWCLCVSVCVSLCVYMIRVSAHCSHFYFYFSLKFKVILVRSVGLWTQAWDLSIILTKSLPFCFLQSHSRNPNPIYLCTSHVLLSFPNQIFTGKVSEIVTWTSRPIIFLLQTQSAMGPCFSWFLFLNSVSEGGGDLHKHYEAVWSLNSFSRIQSPEPSSCPLLLLMLMLSFKGHIVSQWRSWDFNPGGPYMKG